MVKYTIKVTFEIDGELPNESLKLLKGDIKDCCEIFDGEDVRVEIKIKEDKK